MFSQFQLFLDIERLSLNTWHIMNTLLEQVKLDFEIINLFYSCICYIDQSMYFSLQLHMMEDIMMSPINMLWYWDTHQDVHNYQVLYHSWLGEWAATCARLWNTTNSNIRYLLILILINLLILISCYFVIYFHIVLLRVLGQ